MVSRCEVLHNINSNELEGIENMKDSTCRTDQFKKMLEINGGRLVSIYWIFGQYMIHGVAIIDSPDDSTLMSTLLDRKQWKRMQRNFHI